MVGGAKRGFLPIGVALFMVLSLPVLAMGRFFGLVQAFSEYLRPTTAEVGRLPSGCVATGETPSSALMGIVRDEMALRHLTLQSVVVCRTSYLLRGDVEHFARYPISGGNPWRPLYGGCCACQFRRHVIVDAVGPDGRGSVLLHASLIQSRSDYLRLNWNNVRPWALRWCLVVLLFLICARALFVSSRWLAKAIRRRLRDPA